MLGLRAAIRTGDQGGIEVRTLFHQSGAQCACRICGASRSLPVMRCIASSDSPVTSSSTCTQSAVESCNGTAD